MIPLWGWALGGLAGYYLYKKTQGTVSAISGQTGFPSSSAVKPGTYTVNKVTMAYMSDPDISVDPNQNFQLQLPAGTKITATTSPVTTSSGGDYILVNTPTAGLRYINIADATVT